MIYGLTFIPGRGRQSSPEDVLRHFGTMDGHVLGLRLLRDAVDRRDGTDADSALAVCATIGITARGLARKAIWGLGKTPGPEAEEALRLLLDEPDEIVRENAARQLSYLNACE